MKVKELLSDESKWTRGSFARDRLFRVTSSKSSDATCWCLMGAVLKCYGASYFDLGITYHEVIFKIQQKLGDHSMGTWNDTHTFEDVKKLVEELDI